MTGIEEYQRLKNNILSLDSGDAVKTIMVSSSTLGEGTSTVASNLAVALAENSSPKILLIDSNLRHPTLHKMFKLQNSDGLADLVTGDMNVGDVLRKTELPNLSLITAGNSTSNPVGVLESHALKALITKLKNEFDYLILDSVPINAYPDVSILSGLVDGVILVVHSGKTRWEVAQKAKEQLQMAHANILGVVLNVRKYVIPKFIYKRL